MLQEGGAAEIGTSREQNTIQGADVLLVTPLSSDLSKSIFSVNIPNVYVDTHRVRKQLYAPSFPSARNKYIIITSLKGNCFAFCQSVLCFSALFSSTTFVIQTYHVLEEDRSHFAPISLVD